MRIFLLVFSSPSLHIPPALSSHSPFSEPVISSYSACHSPLAELSSESHCSIDHRSFRDTPLLLSSHFPVIEHSLASCLYSFPSYNYIRSLLSRVFSHPQLISPDCDCPLTVHSSTSRILIPQSHPEHVQPHIHNPCAHGALLPVAVAPASISPPQIPCRAACAGFRRRPGRGRAGFIRGLCVRIISGFLPAAFIRR